MPIPSGGRTWQSDPNWSETSPTRFKTMPAKVTPSQPGLRREATRAQPSRAKSQCVGPPTASSPETRDQPEEPNSKRFRLSGNIASTGISPVPPTPQTTRGLTNDKPHTPHVVARTTTIGARTKHPVSVRTGQVHPAANPPSSCCWLADPCQATSERARRRLRELVRGLRRSRGRTPIRQLRGSVLRTPPDGAASRRAALPRPHPRPRPGGDRHARAARARLRRGRDTDTEYLSGPIFQLLCELEGITGAHLRLLDAT
jgi:hypothetical protein